MKSVNEVGQNKSHGRNWDVLIKENPFTDDILVYADKGLESLIYNVEGVEDVTVQTDFLYTVGIDPRYDREYVIEEIKAAILCEKPE